MHALSDCAQRWHEDCSRVTAMSVLCFCSLLLGIVLCAFNRRWNQKFSPLLLILGMSMVQLVLLCCHYGFARHVAILLFIQRCLYVLEFCLVFFFFAVLACRVTRQRHLIKRLVFPVVAAVSVIVVVCFTVAIIIDSVNIQCTNWVWLTLNLTSVLVGCALIAVASVVTKGVNRQQWADFRMKKSRRLWSLIVVNCISSATALIWDIAITTRNNDCHTFVMGYSGGEVFAWILHRTVMNLCPIWAVMAVCVSLPGFSLVHSGRSFFSGVSAQALLERPDIGPTDEDDEVDVLQSWKKDFLWHNITIISETEAFNAASVGSALSVPDASSPGNW
eukprot:c53_g1_i1.p1 GENE.c53_g1_i1~~c53_g1_i1.p1  ORF type:complete len:333 (+),score=58.39 c53_g1_i1:42-1040(+)